ncbi:GH25 family lysozyme [uncultured Streptococcus sp.]|uniref:GH25 family lysozyme n=1 Tax=uncultured Streptococcus sp. TaxID=83427 RepID=UPI00280B8130|nr:GH25 family lysozyme [uncultured Streptococcus sp.]
MKKNDLFIDVSSHNGYDITGILADMGTQNTIIKVSESTNYLNPCRHAQVEQSNPIGFYHFAWFGGDVDEAEREARYFLENVPVSVPYLVLDYEDHASNDVQANTDACIKFMQILADDGYKPIYYSYKPFTLANVDYQQILAKFPDSLWIAGYGLNDGTANFEYFPSMDGISWWQYSSNPFDQNIVLLDDEPEQEARTAGTWKKDSNGWWFRRDNGSFPYNKWEKIAGVWYYFNERGYSIASRWLKDDGKWYYLKENGAMATGWVFVNGKWYYLNASGEMVTGWVQYKDKLYHLKEENGEMSSEELVKVEGGWYYINEDGSRSDKPAFNVLPDGLIVTTK